jgi:putative transcriptional regulator
MRTNVRRVLDSGSKKEFKRNNYLTGKLLVAMPFMEDNRFDHAVIYVCGHDEYGAIGLMINKPLNSLTFADLLMQLDIAPLPVTRPVQMQAGGAVEVSRGFVLHSTDYHSESTVRVGEQFCITATLDILRTLAQGKGPRKFLLALGYTGWGSNQLEQEIQDNYWIVVEPSEEIVFNSALDFRWRASMASLGVDPLTLSLESGRA